VFTLIFKKYENYIIKKRNIIFLFNNFNFVNKIEKVEVHLTHAVGVRTYQIYVTKKGSSEYISLDDAALAEKFPAFLQRFVTENQVTRDVALMEKTWRFSEKNNQGDGNSRGFISYGRYGYAASLVDTKTGTEKYKRQVSDSEMYDLYYRFWLPDQERFATAAFSSFSGKSCITLVLDEMKKSFETKNSNFLLKIRKLMPSGAAAKIYAGRDVKNLRLVTRKPPSDLADQLFQGKSQRVQRMTLTIHSGRNSRIGSFSDLIAGLPSDASGVIQYDGIEFDEAVAMVKIGNDLRPVGVFGAHTDVGVVDITEQVVKGSDGLPTYQSLDTEVSIILESVYETLSGQAK
jgi:hypothetical protein